MENGPVPRSVIILLRDAALVRGLRGGRDGGVIAALEELSRGLFDGAAVFASVFAGPPPSRTAASGWRGIGDAFWRESGVAREERRLDGSFYTPDAVIDRIVDLVRRDLSGDGGDPVGAVCDPAVGCGYFLLRLVETLKKKYGGKKIRRWASSSLYGVDMNPGAVFMTRALLWLTLSDGREEFMPAAEHFPCGDSLLGAGFGEVAGAEVPAAGLDWGEAFPDVAARGGFDAIIGNPPYEVLTNFGRRPERRVLADALRASGFYRDALTGQINLYRCFIERSLGLLREGGALSFVVPLSLARDGAAAALRRRLLEAHGAAEWALFGERDDVFGGVTQAACIFLARKNAGPAKRLSVFAGGERSRLALSELRGGAEGEYVVPMLDRAGVRLWRWLWKHVRGRFGEAATMRVGEVDQTVFRACMRDDDTGCVLARGSHLTPFRLDVSPLPGKERFLDLDLFLRMKGASADACRERAGAWRVAQLGIRNMETRPRLVAALAPPGVYMGNSLNVYVPVDGVSLEFLAGVLNSRLLDWLFRVGSGNNNINLAEMRGLPFPLGCSADAVDAVATAYRECVRVAAEGGALAPVRARLDGAVEACYGMPEEFGGVLG